MADMTVKMDIFWHESDHPARIRLANHDHRFGPGLSVVFTADPLSADYAPTMLNRIARARAAAGLPAPPECPEASRKLRDRMPLLVARYGVGTGVLL